MTVIYPHPIDNPSYTFVRVEQNIKVFLDSIIRQVIIKRDQFHQQLVDVKLDYVNKEELRKKQFEELEKMIGEHKYKRYTTVEPR